MNPLEVLEGGLETFPLEIELLAVGVGELLNGPEGLGGAAVLDLLAVLGLVSQGLTQGIQPRLGPGPDFLEGGVGALDQFLDLGAGVRRRGARRFGGLRQLEKSTLRAFGVGGCRLWASWGPSVPTRC